MTDLRTCPECGNTEMRQINDPVTLLPRELLVEVIDRFFKDHPEQTIVPMEDVGPGDKHPVLKLRQYLSNV